MSQPTPYITDDKALYSELSDLRRLIDQLRGRVDGLTVGVAPASVAVAQPAQPPSGLFMQESDGAPFGTARGLEVDQAAGFNLTFVVDRGKISRTAGVTSPQNIALETPLPGTSIKAANEDHVHILPDSGVAAGSYTNASFTVNDEGLLTAASSGSSSSRPGIASFVSDGKSFVIPSALTRFNGSRAYRTKFDLTLFTQARVVVGMPSAPGANVDIRVRYSTDAFSTADYLDGSAGPSVTVSAIGTNAGSWVNLAAGAKADVEIEFYCINGDDITTVAFGNVVLEVK